jgi:hypothetical protein
MGGGASKVQATPASQDKRLVVIMADYDGCFDALFRFSPAVSGQTEDESKEVKDFDRYTFDKECKPDEEAYIKALQEWLKQQTERSDTMLYCGSNRQSKKADLAVNLFKTAPRKDKDDDGNLKFPFGKYPSMVKWIQDQKLNEGYVGLCLKDYEGLASVPSAVLPGYGGKPWHLVPSLLEDRLTGKDEGTEWGRRDNVSAEGAVTKFGQINTHKDEAATALEEPVEVKFDLFDTVAYHGKVPADKKVEEECKQKLAIMRHQLESMATHVAKGADTYSSVQVYYIDDRMDLLDYVGPHIGVTSNAKLIAKLGSKAKAFSFATVNFVWKKEKKTTQAKPTVKHTSCFTYMEEAK